MYTPANCLDSVFVRLGIFCCTWLIALVPGYCLKSAAADIVTGQFTATVDHVVIDTIGAFPGLSVGSLVTGTFTYEDNSAAYDSITGTHPVTYTDTFPDNGFFSWEVTIEGTTRNMANALALGTGGNPYVVVQDSTGFQSDYFVFHGRVTGTSPGQFTEVLQLALYDPTQSVFDNELLPSTLDLADFTDFSGSGMEISTTSGTTAFYFSFTSFSASSVPEPSMAVIGLISVCATAGLRRRRCWDR